MRNKSRLSNFERKASDPVRGQVRTGQDRTGQDRTGQDRTAPDRTGPTQNTTGQPWTRQDNSDLSSTARSEIAARLQTEKGKQILLPPNPDIGAINENEKRT